jgi:putative chitinase
MERDAQDEYWFTGYYGRGFTALKLKEKYSEFGTKLKLALVSNPDLALDPTNAAKILVYGMKNGTFSGEKLSTYVFEDMMNFVSARKVVQDTRDADGVAKIADQILAFD